MIENDDSDPRKLVALRPIADSSYGWVIVLASFLIHVFTDGFVYSFGVLADSLIVVNLFNNILV